MSDIIETETFGNIECTYSEKFRCQIITMDVQYFQRLLYDPYLIKNLIEESYIHFSGRFIINHKESISPLVGFYIMIGDYNISIRHHVMEDDPITGKIDPITHEFSYDKISHHQYNILLIESLIRTRDQFYEIYQNICSLIKHDTIKRVQP